ncbi:MAG: GDP-mannose 4,6-dehydratase [Nitrospirae bacterium]|nr:GDP-mannose 4,6-dehydratase [Nitrospirota bacterium]MBF0540432.1 GDP-mannose 4,6-dehydratase [Nitrospirota bacterium]
MEKSALITGVTGQDGAYLSRLLLNKGYKVYGTYRRSSTPNFWRPQALGIFDQIRLIPSDLTDHASLLEAITLSQPDEIYNLAAQSFVGASFEQPLMSTDVNSLGVTRMLEAIRLLNPKIKLYQASTSEMFGNVTQDQLPINEDTPMIPCSPYACAKLYGYHIVKIYREAYGLFACNGILFNHESPLRGIEFITRKISNAVAKIVTGMEKKIHLGNIDSRRDWGYAEEYVDAMWRMMQLDAPQDIIIATGKAYSVRELIIEAFKCVDIENWEDYIEIDKKHMRPMDVNVLIGDPSKAKRLIGWEPKMGFSELVSLMVKEDLNKWRRYIGGEIFPWDAPNYPTETTILTRALKM